YKPLKLTVEILRYGQTGEITIKRPNNLYPDRQASRGTPGGSDSRGQLTEGRQSAPHRRLDDRHGFSIHVEATLVPVFLIVWHRDPWRSWTKKHIVVLEEFGPGTAHHGTGIVKQHPVRVAKRAELRRRTHRPAVVGEIRREM